MKRRYLCSRFCRCVSSARECVVAFCALALAAILGLLPTIASAQLALPDTGVDLPGYIALIIVGLGTIVAAAVGGMAAFAVIRLGMKWLGIIK